MVRFHLSTVLAILSLLSDADSSHIHDVTDPAAHQKLLKVSIYPHPGLPPGMFSLGVLSRVKPGPRRRSSNFYASTFLPSIVYSFRDSYPTTQRSTITSSLGTTRGSKRLERCLAFLPDRASKSRDISEDKFQDSVITSSSVYICGYWRAPFVQLRTISWSRGSHLIFAFGPL